LSSNALLQRVAHISIAEDVLVLGADHRERGRGFVSREGRQDGRSEVDRDGYCLDSLSINVLELE
jgi:hypothetical protein